MAPGRDGKRIEADWLGGEDPERGVAVSSRVLQEFCDGRRDPVAEWDTLAFAAEAQFDGPGGRPARVLAALRAVGPALRHAEAFGGYDTCDRLRIRCRHQVLVTRAFHMQKGCEREALENGYALVEHVVDLAEGYDALAAVLRRPTTTAVAESAVAALGIHLATLRAWPAPLSHVAPGARRRAVVDAETRERLVRRARRLVEAYALESEQLVVYERTPALGAQGFYLFKAEGDPRDARLVEALYGMDVATREDYPRSQATVPLRELEWARLRGDAVAAARHRESARASLERFPMRRHQRVVEERGILAA